ncbi:MAG: DMT family transporter [Solitalea-like symbiont of Tyrophagus putrescentiae]
MSWIFLIIAGLLEISFTTFLQLSKNFTKIGWTIAFFIAAVGSFYFLNKATDKIPLGTCYAIWTGIGALGTVLIGIIFFNEPKSMWRLFFLLTLLLSIIGLKLVSNSAH